LFSGNRKRGEGSFPVRQRRDHAAASCHGNEFIQHAVQADDSGRFAFVEVAENGFANIGAKFLPCVGFGDDKIAKRVGDETAVSVVLSCPPARNKP
jgi:hypothetical protein